MGTIAVPAARSARAAAAQAVRNWLAFGLSIFAVFVLQSASPVRHADFWLPLLSLALTVGVWVVVQFAPVGKPASASPESALRPGGRAAENWIALGAIGALALGASLLRYTALCCVTPSRPPETSLVVGALAVALVAGMLVCRTAASRRYVTVAWLFIGVLVLGLAVTKIEPLAIGASSLARLVSAQNVTQAGAADLAWLGYSYIAFRLIHVLRDVQGNKRAGMTLREFVTYVVFAPSLIAGPIDRAERFAKDLRAPYRVDGAVVGAAGARALIGAFKKFVLADALALIALNAAGAAATESAVWTWVMVYAYAFRIYFDFGGYTDLAIAGGLLFGVKLPENFAQPYRQANLTQFWNSWHMTLAQWFRAYWFNPLTRWLRTTHAPSGSALPTGAIIFAGQMSTMLLIGLWHGVTPNFLIWGVWHGTGLFVHNRYAEWAKKRPARDSSPRRQRVVRAANVLLTFNFVALGWVWFALPSPSLSLRVFGAMLGIGVAR